MIGYRMGATITKADYEVLVPEMEALVAEYGTVQLLCDLTDFRWEEPSAWGADMHFGKKFHHKITKMAIVGDGFVQKMIADLAQPFYADEARYFPDADEAWAWLSAG